MLIGVGPHSMESIAASLRSGLQILVLENSADFATRLTGMTSANSCSQSPSEGRNYMPHLTGHT